MANHLDLLNKELDSKAGILRLKPAFVARDFYPGLGRLGLKDYEVGERGWLCERWVASCVEASNAIPLKDEGLSFIKLSQSDEEMSLREALKLQPARLLGGSYSKTHQNRFGVLSKILDIGVPIPWHIHAQKRDAKRYWNMNPKEEAYYFLETEDLGPLPYSHLAVHPDVGGEDLLPILKRWNDDKVLDLSPAYRLNIGEGYHILPGVPHAPGTALTLELQEESDVYNILQAFCNNRLLSKEELLLRGVPDEAGIIAMIDWERSKDPLFYSKYHTAPEEVGLDKQQGCEERWVFHPKRSRKFSGKELKVEPDESFVSREKGAYVILAWKGRGHINRIPVAGKNHELDELFVSYEAAVQPHQISNDGDGELVLYKIFGPDVNR